MLFVPGVAALAYDLESGRILARHETGPLAAVGRSREGLRLCAADGCVAVLPMDGGAARTIVQAPGLGVNAAVTEGPDGSIAVCVENRLEVFAHDGACGVNPPAFAALVALGDTLAWSEPGGSHLALGGARRRGTRVGSAPPRRLGVGRGGADRRGRSGRRPRLRGHSTPSVIPPVSAPAVTSTFSTRAVSTPFSISTTS